MKYFDKDEKVVRNGDIIDIHQTVNGQNLFVVLSTNPLNVRCGYNLLIKYEYDQDQLLSPDPFSGQTCFEIIGNVYDFKLKK